jgi:hypothetical protein
MRNLILDANCAQHFGVATFGEYRTREVGEGAGEFNGPVFIRRSVVLASQGSSPVLGQPQTLPRTED